LLDYYDRNYEHAIQTRKGKYERILTLQDHSMAEIADILVKLKTTT
jgi:hypothetical protein